MLIWRSSRKTIAPPKIGELYRHYKGEFYTVTDVTMDTEEKTFRVTYIRADGSDPTRWSRILTQGAGAKTYYGWADIWYDTQNEIEGYRFNPVNLDQRNM